VKLRWAEPLLVRLAAGLAWLLAGTWRIRWVGREHRDAAFASGRPVIYALWHSRILPLLFTHRHQRVVLLVSRHRDGGYLVALGARWGYRSVRGSSGRGGEIGLLGVVRALQEGGPVAITPDGPRGPAEQVKPGVVAAAQHAGAIILPLAARAPRAWRLRSWDRFVIPKPFAPVEIRYGPPFTVADGKPGLAAGVARLGEALRSVTDDALAPILTERPVHPVPPV
jgi:hypothetical protein